MALFKFNRNAPSTGEHPFFELPLIIASGLGRSGTTVLRQCLAAHPRVASYNKECNYIHNLMRAANLHVETFPESPPVGRREFWKVHRRALLDIYWPQANWRAPDEYSAISTYSMLDPRAAIGLKDAFPRLAICYIVRNGIEVVSSYNSFRGFKDMTFEDVCKLWSLRQDMLQYQSSQSHIFLFRHEWLIDELEAFKRQMADAFQSIGLNFDEACLAPLSTRFHPTRFIGEDRQAAKDPAQRTRRWKLWSDDQRETFATICGEAMENHGYEIPWL
ncbi:sulfotransferase [Novipirellula rosea]|uniref:Sulfotransferase domain protein n=1 Tax=Novipirellula rosea TaxID=1031540 RepID=A0ABP8NIA1_9BACT